jgi:hypothetical protein
MTPRNLATKANEKISKENEKNKEPWDCCIEPKLKARISN